VKHKGVEGNHNEESLFIALRMGIVTYNLSRRTSETDF